MSSKRDFTKPKDSQEEDLTADLEAAAVGSPKTASERRSRRRALISAPVRVRRINATDDGPDEISTTLDVSRSGILFVSPQGAFMIGMEVAVTFPYSKSPVAIQAEQTGRVARIS